MRTTKSTQDSLLQRIAAGQTSIGIYWLDARVLERRGLVRIEGDTAIITAEGRAYYEARKASGWR